MAPSSRSARRASLRSALNERRPPRWYRSRPVSGCSGRDHAASHPRVRARGLVMDCHPRGSVQPTERAGPESSEVKGVSGRRCPGTRPKRMSTAARIVQAVRTVGSARHGRGAVGGVPRDSIDLLPHRRGARPWARRGERPAPPPHRNLADAPERPIGAREREAPRLMGGNGCLRPHTNRVVMAGPGRPPMTTGPTPAGMRQPAEARRRQATRPRRANAAAMGARLGKPPEAQSSSSSQSSPSSGPSPGPGPGAGAWLPV